MIRCSNQWNHDPPKPFQITLAGCLPTVVSIFASMGLPSRPFKCRVSAKSQKRGKQCPDGNYLKFSNGHFSSSVNAKWVPAAIVLKKGLNRKRDKMESTEGLADMGRNYTALFSRFVIATFAKDIRIG